MKLCLADSGNRTGHAEHTGCWSARRTAALILACATFDATLSPHSTFSEGVEGASSLFLAYQLCLGLTDCSWVHSLGLWFKSMNFRVKKGPDSPDRRYQIGLRRS